MCVLRASSAAPGHSSSCFRDLSSLFAAGVTVPPLVSYFVFCVLVSFLYDILSEDCLSEQSTSVSGLRQCTFLVSVLVRGARTLRRRWKFAVSGKSDLREFSHAGLCRLSFRCHVPHVLVFPGDLETFGVSTFLFLRCLSASSLDLLLRRFGFSSSAGCSSSWQVRMAASVSDGSDLQFLRTRNQGCRLDRHCWE